MAGFDVEGARKAGYSDAEIVDHLARERRFDAAAARKSGYSDSELLGHLRPPLSQMRVPTAAEQRGTVETIGRSLALGARGVVGGVNDMLGGVPGMALDAATYPGRVVARAFGATDVKPPTQMLDEALPTPETPGERTVDAINRSGAGMIPTVGVGAIPAVARAAPRAADFLTRQLVGQYAGAAGAGAAGQYAQDQGAGTGGQVAASLGGALAGAGAAGAVQAGGRGLAALLQPFSERGREALATEALLRSSSDPAGLGQRLVAGLDDPTRRLPGAVPTTGTAARDPALLRTESSVRAGAIGPQAQSTLADSDFARTGVRTAAMDAMGDGSNPAARGVAVRETLGNQQDEVRGLVRAAYQSVDPDNVARFPVDDIRGALRGSLDRLYGPGSGGPPAELARVLDELPAGTAADPAAIDWRYLQNLRSRLGGIAGRARAQGDQPLAAAAGQAWDAVERTAVQQLGPDVVDGLPERWRTAQAWRRQQGEMYQRAPTGADASGRILRQDNFGTPMLPDERVTQTALRSPDNVRQVLAAAGPEAEAVRAQLRGQFLDELTTATQAGSSVANTAGQVQRQLTIAGFQKYMDKNRDVANLLFPPGQRRDLDRLIADFTEGSVQANTGATRNSQTMQNLSVAGLISRSTNGLVDPSSPLAMQLGSLGGLMRVVYSSPEQATRDLVARALADPELARALLAKASPEAVQRAAGYLERGLGGRLLQSVQDAATRSRMPTAAAEATRQPPQE